MLCEGNLKLRSHSRSCWLTEVVTKAGYSIDLFYVYVVVYFIISTNGHKKKTLPVFWKYDDLSKWDIFIYYNFINEIKHHGGICVNTWLSSEPNCICIIPQVPRFLRRKCSSNSAIKIQTPQTFRDSPISNNIP